jgi:hypothetical protein
MSPVVRYIYITMLKARYTHLCPDEIERDLRWAIRMVCKLNGVDGIQVRSR